MNKLFLAFGIFLLSYITTLTEVRAQFVYTSCDRSTIEKYPEEEKRPVLLYLDAARKQTEKFMMKLLTNSKFEKISAFHDNRDVVIYVKRKSAFGGVAMSFPEFEEEYGHISFYEYRYQRISYHLGDAIKLSADVAYTIYAVKTERLENDLIYLSLETSQKSSKETPIVRNIFFKEGETKVLEGKFARCGSMRYGLQVELQKQ